MRSARVVVLSVLSLVLVVVLAACSSSSVTGSLGVTVSGLPSGVGGKVVVSGPGGYSQTVTSTTTLSVAPGTYSVTVGATVGPNGIVPVAYDGTASPSTVTVTANNTSSTSVSYAARSGSGFLWLADGTAVGGYQNVTLASNGSTGPDVTLSGVASSLTEDVAVDHAGNLWVSDFGGYVYRFDAASLASSGSPSPSVTINGTAHIGGSGFLGLAFDAAGDLWVSTWGGNQLLMYTPSQLAANGSPAPSVIISANSGSLNTVGGIAFDANGDLWATNNFNSTVVEYTPSQLAATGNPVPNVTISATASSLSSPRALAFDASGNLWVANDANTVVRFDASQLAVTGSPTPAATIGSASLGSKPEGLAIDASGALWVAEFNSTDLRRFTNASSLSGSVTPTPDVIITSIGSPDTTGIAFSPPPSGLPIQTP